MRFSLTPDIENERGIFLTSGDKILGKANA
jgi:hypothetical protein